MTKRYIASAYTLYQFEVRQLGRLLDAQDTMRSAAEKIAAHLGDELSKAPALSVLTSRVIRSLLDPLNVEGAYRTTISGRLYRGATVGELMDFYGKLGSPRIVKSYEPWPYPLRPECGSVPANILPQKPKMLPATSDDAPVIPARPPGHPFKLYSPAVIALSELLNPDDTFRRAAKKIVEHLGDSLPVAPNLACLVTRVFRSCFPPIAAQGHSSQIGFRLKCGATLGELVSFYGTVESPIPGFLGKTWPYSARPGEGEIDPKLLRSDKLAGEALLRTRGRNMNDSDTLEIVIGRATQNQWNITPKENHQDYVLSMFFSRVHPMIRDLYHSQFTDVVGFGATVADLRSLFGTPTRVKAPDLQALARVKRDIERRTAERENPGAFARNQKTSPRPIFPVDGQA